MLHRFISEDPIGSAGGLNLYAYVANDPVNFTDPFGLAMQGEEECIVTISETSIFWDCGLGSEGGVGISLIMPGTLRDPSTIGREMARDLHRRGAASPKDPTVGYGQGGAGGRTRDEIIMGNLAEWAEDAGPALETATVVGLGAPLVLMGGAEVVGARTLAYTVEFRLYPNKGGWGVILYNAGQQLGRIEWHKFYIKGRGVLNRLHYHRRPGIGKHRPWQGGW